MDDTNMLALFDDASTGRQIIFDEPQSTIIATSPQDVPVAFAAISRAVAEGCYVAGWFSYELGYVLESRHHPVTPGPGDVPLIKLGVYDRPSDIRPRPHGRAYAGPLSHEWSRPDYEKAFNRTHQLIGDGDIYQANLSFRSRFRFLGDPFCFYEMLLADSDASHCAFIDDGERQILSISPELFFEMSADGALSSRPMKGTASRQHNDEMERLALAASAKDRAENLMIVDLIRNDLSRISEIGSVQVKDLFRVETYPTLHTMVSTVTARKRSDVSIAEILTAVFPCGSITGAPKIRAMQILRYLESSHRGIYCGALGYFSPDGSARFNVAIRTITIQSGQGELGVGGGVVQDSVVDNEYAECLLKMSFFKRHRKPLELIETLRFDEGFVRLESHLERLRKSAVAFDLPYHNEKAQQSLHAAVAGKSGPLRVRMTLDEAGVFRSSAVPLAPNPSQWTYSISPERVQSTDVLRRHKTNWRDQNDQALMRAGTHEVVFLNERGEVVEGAYSNVFIKRGNTLLTPSLKAGALDGRLRAELIAQGKATEATLFADDLNGEVLFGNSLRGLVAGIRAGG